MMNAQTLRVKRKDYFLTLIAEPTTCPGNLIDHFDSFLHPIIPDICPLQVDGISLSSIARFLAPKNTMSMPDSCINPFSCRIIGRMTDGVKAGMILCRW